MLFFNASVRDSKIAGKGLFLEQFVRKTQVVAIYSHGLSLIPEGEYQRRALSGDELIIKTGCRFVNDIFIYRETGMEDEDYVNHSPNPNLLYHCGICFAKQNIFPGEELTINYQYLLSAGEPGFIDSQTRDYVMGLPAEIAMLKSASELTALCRSVVEVNNMVDIGDILTLSRQRLQAGSSF